MMRVLIFLISSLLFVSSAMAQQPVKMNDGANATQGAKADAAVTDSTTTNSLISFMKGLVKILADTWDNVNHRLNVAVVNTPSVLQSGTWTVQPGNTQNTTAWLTQPQGGVAHGATDSGNPVKIGCQARTTNRTAVTDGQRADVVCDQNGELLVTPIAQRARVGRSGVVTVSTTTETTLVAAGGAGVFRDLTYLKCTNGSATLTRMDLRDATAGTVIDTWWLAANGGGFNIPFSVAYPQATANNNWTIQLSTAVTDVRCAAEYVEKN